MKANKAQFNFNDVVYCNWYDSEYERADQEGENIDIDTIKARKINAKYFIDFLNDELKTKLIFNDLVFQVIMETILENGLNDDYDFYFDRYCIYDELHNECITFNED